MFFYYPIEVGFCSLLFQTTDISCDGRGTSDLVSVPHFQLQMDHYRQRSTENPDICSSHECTHLLENSLPSCSGNWLKMSSMKISMRLVYNMHMTKIVYVYLNIHLAYRYRHGYIIHIQLYIYIQAETETYTSTHEYRDGKPRVNA